MGNSTKNFFKSKTEWGIFFAVLPTVLTLFGIPIPVGVGELITIMGGSLGGYGRYAATQRLNFKK